MSDEYTPTTEEVREAAYELGSIGVTYDGFDRWLAEVERAAAEKAWDRAESAFEEAHNADMLEPWPHLRENPYRAAEIREGE